MRRPRASIAEIMAVVAVIALDCGAAHQILTMETANRVPSHWEIFAEVDLIGGLPMANLLGLVAWRSRRRPGPASRAFLAVGGALTVAFVVATAIVPLIVVYPAELSVKWIGDACYPAGTMPLFVVLPAFSAVLTLAMLLPAMLVGWFLGRFRLVIERRRPVAAGMAAQLA